MSAGARARILLVEDTPALARTYEGFLRREPYDVEHVATGREALAVLSQAPPDAVLLDLRLPDIDGMAVLAEFRARDQATPVIVVTAHGSLEAAVAAMRAGASDFLAKPIAAERLRVTLGTHLEKQALARVVHTYRERIDRSAFQGFVGGSLAMQAVYRSIESAATSDATVFLTGDSGTGKEVAAAAVHALSRRRDAPFLPLNCAAIPRDLMESEIFGHVKGAFSGAVADRLGAARQADGGTLFLDEICEMDLALQAKLLRFVQTGTFNRVGGARPESVDVRFVCATNRDPRREVAAGRFREDLFYRLHVIPVHLPPLREREGDVLLIARRLLAAYAAEERKAFSGFDAAAEAVLDAYPWPGNVRELQNVVRNVVVLHDGDRVSVDMLPAWLRAGLPPRVHPEPSSGGPSDAGTRDDRDLATLARSIRPLAEVERQAIETAIVRCGGDVRLAAVLLGIAPATISRRLRAWRGAGDEPGAAADG